MRLTLAAAVVVAFALSAFADDPPGLIRAKELVEAERGDPHREKMRIVWPETVEAKPPEGAEVLVITGFTEIVVTRLVWNEGRVEARRVYTAPVWHDNPEGEPLRTWTFDVSPEALTTAWSASRYILAARDERVAAKPEVELPGGGAGRGHHTGSFYRRLRDPKSEAPLLAGDPLGPYWNGEEVLHWDGIQHASVFAAFAPLFPKDRTALRESADSGSWVAFLNSEFRRAATRLDPEYFGEHCPLFDVALRIAGEIGDDATIAAMNELEKALRMDDRCYWAAGVIREIAIARQKTQLRLHWKLEDARELLELSCPRDNIDSAADLWIRRRFREREPAAYLSFLEMERSRGIEPRRDDVARTLDAIRTAGAGQSSEALRPYLKSPDADARVAAARGILTVLADDPRALATIVKVLRDAAVLPDLRGPTIRWARVDALDEAIERRLFGASELREMLADETSQHGYLVRALLGALRRTNEPPTAEETLAAWRRVVDRDGGAGIEFAIDALLDLKDVESRDKIAAAINRASSYWGGGDYRVDVEKLRRRFRAAMPEPSTAEAPVRDNPPSPR